MREIIVINMKKYCLNNANFIDQGSNWKNKIHHFE